MDGSTSLYDLLDLPRSASATEVRRAYRSAVTRHHPDKGGDAGHFRLVQQAFAVLSDSTKRKHYDETGRVLKSADEAFAEAFAATASPLLHQGDSAAAGTTGGVGGATSTSTSSIRAPGPAGSSAKHQRQADAAQADRNEGSITPTMMQLQLAQQPGEPVSHSAGFEAWLRARGEADGTARVITADAVAAQFGVSRASYTPVALPYQTEVSRVVCTRGGSTITAGSNGGNGGGVLPGCEMDVEYTPLPEALEWGEVLVEMRCVPITPADLYSVRTGGVYGPDSRDPPFVVGHDGYGVVAKVGPGVKALAEGDLVMPLVAFTGTWTSAAVWPENSLLRLPCVISSAEGPEAEVPCTGGDCSNTGAKGAAGSPAVPEWLLAVAREVCLAYRLLQDKDVELKPGAAVVLNAATSSVGQLLLQLCRALRLRAYAVARDHGKSDWQRTRDWLLALGACEVFKDEGSLKHQQLQSHQHLPNLVYGGRMHGPGAAAHAGLPGSRPLLALDCVGGASALRLADYLADGGKLVVYGCVSGKAPAWQWHDFVFRNIKVEGFNVRRWLGEKPGRVAPILAAVGGLARAGLLKLNTTEYDLTSEWREAMEHSHDPAKHTKVLLRVAQPLASQPCGAAAHAVAYAPRTRAGDELTAAAAGKVLDGSAAGAAAHAAVVTARVQ